MSEDLIRVASTIDDIVVARGQTDPAAIINTYEILWRAFEASDGRVTPGVVKSFLNSSVPMARTLTDDGLVNLIAVIDSGNRQ